MSKFLNEKNVEITKREHTFKGYASSFNVEILSSFNPEVQRKDSEFTENKVKELLTGFRGFEFMTTLVLMLTKKESEDKTKYGTFYPHPKSETIINQSEISHVFESICSTVI